MKGLRITISGMPYSGKTTIALDIARSMEALGFKVNLKDPSLFEGQDHMGLQHHRLESLIARGLSIDVHVVHLYPEPKTDPDEFEDDIPY